MRRENFLERATFAASGLSHTFKPMTNAVSPRRFRLVFLGPPDDSDEGVSNKVNVVLEFGDGDSVLFKHNLTLANTTGGELFSETFDTNHSEVKVTISADDSEYNAWATVEVRCIAGPRRGGINGTGFGTAKVAA